MLQQTQVQTVLPYYRRFLQRFPDVRSLAVASEADVLALWAGLGYYSRARNLRRAAVTVVEKFGGEIPGTRDQLLALPGVGRYIAGALLSIAFNRPEPVVDGNVRRVISRLHCLTCAVPESFFWRQAEAWVPAGRPADFNQAVMELGATVCVPSSPACPRCPVAALCRARARGLQGGIRRAGVERPSEKVRVVILVLVRGCRVLLTREREAKYIPGEWGLPVRPLGPRLSPGRAARELAMEFCEEIPPMERLPTLEHGITHRRITAHVRKAELSGRARLRSAGRWFAISDLPRFLVSSLFQKAAARALQSPRF
jgi:A/G-specific adenine glycosylase